MLKFNRVFKRNFGKIIQNEIDPDDKQFKINALNQSNLIKDLKSKISLFELGGGKQARDRHLSKNKLLPRDRINALLDPGYSIH